MINIIRSAIYEALFSVELEKPVLLPYTKEEMNELFFDKKIDENGEEYYNINPIIYKIIDKIDCTNVSLSNVDLRKKCLKDVAIFVLILKKYTTKI